MVAPGRIGSRARPIDGGSPTAPAAGGLSWLLQPRRPNWRPPLPERVAAYAYSGSTSAGTYSSTTYTSSRGSALSSELDLASRLSRIHLSSGLEDGEENMKKIERVKRLVKEFYHGDRDISAVVERWLSELGVGWVLGLPDECNLTENWIRALIEITEEDVLVEVVLEPAFQLVFKEIVLKMLSFVDALLLADAGTDTADATNGAQAPSERKIQTLLDVRDAVSSAAEGIELCFGYRDEVLSLLSAKEQRLDEAVWNTMEEVRTSILNDDDDEWATKTRQGSPDICKVTRYLITYIKSLGDNYRQLNHIVRRAAELGDYYVPEQDKTDPLTTLAMEMVHSLQVKLAERSEAFPNHSLRLLFLINNTHFIWQHLHPLFRMKFHVAVLTTKIEDYIQKYLQVSWTPVLSCLYNHTPRWFRKNSALPKFELEFQRTYTAQKHWKVPDPELRTRLRKAIVKKVVSGLTKYLEDNKITSPGITPQEGEEMLLELFEG